MCEDLCIFKVMKVVQQGMLCAQWCHNPLRRTNYRNSLIIIINREEHEWTLFHIDPLCNPICRFVWQWAVREGLQGNRFFTLYTAKLIISILWGKLEGTREPGDLHGGAQTRKTKFGFSESQLTVSSIPQRTLRCSDARQPTKDASNINVSPDLVDKQYTTLHEWNSMKISTDPIVDTENV